MAGFEPLVFDIDEPSEYEDQFKELEKAAETEQEPEAKAEQEPQPEPQSDDRLTKLEAELAEYRKKLDEKDRALNELARASAPRQEPQPQPRQSEFQPPTDEDWASNPTEAARKLSRFEADQAVKKARQEWEANANQQRQQSVQRDLEHYADRAKADFGEDLITTGTYENYLWDREFRRGVQSGEYRTDNPADIYRAASAIKDKIRKEPPKPPVDDSARQQRLKASAMQTDRKPQKPSDGLPQLTPMQIEHCREYNINPDSFRKALMEMKGGR